MVSEGVLWYAFKEHTKVGTRYWWDRKIDDALIAFEIRVTPTSENVFEYESDTSVMYVLSIDDLEDISEWWNEDDINWRYEILGPVE